MVFPNQVWEDVTSELKGFQDSHKRFRAVNLEPEVCLIVIVGKTSLTKPLYDSIKAKVDQQETAYSFNYGCVTKLVRLLDAELSLLKKMNVSEQFPEDVTRCTKAEDDSMRVRIVEFKVKCNTSITLYVNQFAINHTINRLVNHTLKHPSIIEETILLSNNQSFNYASNQVYNQSCKQSIIQSINQRFN